MSEHLHPDPDSADAPVVGLLEQWEPGERAAHRHRQHQLICVSSGVMHVSTSVGAWILPTTRAIWISAGTEHNALVRRSTSIRVLFVDPDAYDLPRHAYCWVINVSPLMREVINACAMFPWSYPKAGPESRLARVLIDHITTRDHAPVDLPLPADPRALKVAEMLRADPANRESLAALAARAGASPRTIERLFSQEAGITFGNWRQRQRLLRGMEQLAYGESVSNVALEVGYESASSFIVAFKRLFGTTPARYFK